MKTAISRVTKKLSGDGSLTAKCDIIDVDVDSAFIILAP